MKAITQFLQMRAFVVLSIPFLFSACGNDDADPGPALTGQRHEYTLMSVGSSGVNGTATFEELNDNTTRVTLSLTGTSSGGNHPAHIHLNTAAEGGAIAIDLTNVDGATRSSVTEVSTLNDGTPITYAALLNFDGYINVHSSPSDLGTLLAQGDIGQNELTGMSEDYELSSVADPGISGEANFFERVNGETLVTIQLEGDATDSDHPAHIHMNTAAEGGAIVIDLTNVKNGSSKTNITAFNDGTEVTYEELKEYDGYINVHSSASALGTLVAQGDIGENELTGTNEEYPLGPVSDPNLSGTATFAERVNGETLITIALTGDATDSDHPAHIHMNSAAEGGAIVIDLTNVKNGRSKTNVTAFNDATPVTYDELIAYDGYINVHSSASALGTLVAQGDIGVNKLTGTSMEYPLGPVSDPNISGTATFSERINGETLITIALTGDAADSDHPAHIHMNTATEGGGIVIDLKNVKNGSSKTNVAAFNDATPVTYEELIAYDGYINVHSTSTNLGTLIAQGDIGQNALTGTSISYALNPVSDPGISGNATFFQRINGETLVVITLTGTSAGGDHPSHIHMNDAATGGGIVINLKNVNGNTGVSKTNVAKFNDDTAVTYDDLIIYNGYINVHNTSTDLGTLIAQGNIGSNA